MGGPKADQWKGILPEGRIVHLSGSILMLQDKVMIWLCGRKKVKLH